MPDQRNLLQIYLNSVLIQAVILLGLSVKICTQKAVSLIGMLTEWSWRRRRPRASGDKSLARAAEHLGPVDAVGAVVVSELRGPEIGEVTVHHVGTVPRAIDPALHGRAH